MIIGIWIVLIITIVIIGGELRYRCSLKEKQRDMSNVGREGWKNNIDVDLERLSTERLKGDYVPSKVLAMRGSWRLAQEQVLELSSFEELKCIEYGKML